MVFGQIVDRVWGGVRVSANSHSHSSPNALKSNLPSENLIKPIPIGNKICLNWCHCFFCLTAKYSGYNAINCPQYNSTRDSSYFLCSII